MTYRKATIHNAGGLDEWIRQQRERGIAKKEERQAQSLHDRSGSSKHPEATIE